MRQTTEPDGLLALLDELVDGVLFVDPAGRILLASRPFRRSADVLGLSLEGMFVDRLLELADRTSEPYAFTAAVERLRGDSGSLEFEDAAVGSAFELRASPVDAAGRVWVLRDVSEQRRADRARDDRVAALGHELRTPLTSMTGFIELLEDGGAGPLTAEQARYLEIVRRAADRLQGLVDELLEKIQRRLCRERSSAGQRREGGGMIGIVGGGLAAAKCVESYREAGGDDDIVIWSQDPHGPYNRPPLSKRLLRGEAEPPDALVHPLDWYAEHGVDLRLGESVSLLDDVKADSMVIATGARPRHLGGANVLRTIDDSLELRRRGRMVETAVVVGGGFIGCEVTASLTQLGVSVTQIVREPMVFATLQAPPLSEALHETYRAHGVDLRLDATEIPEAELVVAGIGVEPNVELARDAGLEVRSGIVVDERFATARPGVYAIGDVAEFFDPVFRRHRRIEHWSNAAYHGTTLGRILAGDADARYDIVSAFFSEEFGRSFRLFGDADGHDDTRLDGDFAEGDAVLRFLKQGAAVGAVLTGQDEDTENALKDEIRAGAAAVA